MTDVDALVLQEAPSRGVYGTVHYVDRGDDVEMIQEELDRYLEDMQGLNALEPDEVFRRLSAWTARASEIRIQASRTDSAASRRLRSEEIDPFIKECDRQFSYHSRIEAVRHTDVRLAGKL